MDHRRNKNGSEKTFAFEAYRKYNLSKLMEYRENLPYRGIYHLTSIHFGGKD